MVRTEGGDTDFCEEASSGGGAPVVDPTVLAREAVASLTLPRPTVSIGPPASLNEWNAHVVQYHYWFWATGRSTLDTTVTSQGITITIHAVRTGTTIDTQEGTIRCRGGGTPWSRAVAPNEPSPDCGHVFRRAGPHTITQTDSWALTWSALGRSGAVDRTTTASRTIDLRELVSLRVR